MPGGTSSSYSVDLNGNLFGAGPGAAAIDANGNVMSADGTITPGLLPQFPSIPWYVWFGVGVAIFEGLKS